MVPAKHSQVASARVCWGGVPDVIYVSLRFAHSASSHQSSDTQTMTGPQVRQARGLGPHVSSLVGLGPGLRQGQALSGVG